jgi:hypothetical protein
LKSRITYYQSKINTNLTFISFLVLTFFVFYYRSFIVYAQEEIITIVPGSSDSSRYRFFDITEYLINTGEEIKWYNADNIIHNIVITTNDGKTIVTQSQDIKPKGFFLVSYLIIKVNISFSLQNMIGCKEKSLLQPILKL